VTPLSSSPWLLNTRGSCISVFRFFHFGALPPLYLPLGFSFVPALGVFLLVFFLWCVFSFCSFKGKSPFRPSFFLVCPSSPPPPPPPAISFFPIPDQLSRLSLNPWSSVSSRCRPRPPSKFLVNFAGNSTVPAVFPPFPRVLQVWFGGMVAGSSHPAFPLLRGTYPPTASLLTFF